MRERNWIGADGHARRSIDPALYSTENTVLGTTAELGRVRLAVLFPSCRVHPEMLLGAEDVFLQKLGFTSMQCRMRAAAEAAVSLQHLRTIADGTVGATLNGSQLARSECGWIYMMASVCHEQHKNEPEHIHNNSSATICHIIT